MMQMRTELLAELFCQTAAAVNIAVHEAVGRGVDLVSAVASAMPHGTAALVLYFYRIQCDEPVKPSVCDVDAAEAPVFFAAAAFYFSAF